MQMLRQPSQDAKPHQTLVLTTDLLPHSTMPSCTNQQCPLKRRILIFAHDDLWESSSLIFSALVRVSRLSEHLYECELFFLAVAELAVCSLVFCAAGEVPTVFCDVGDVGEIGFS